MLRKIIVKISCLLEKIILPQRTVRLFSCALIGLVLINSHCANAQNTQLQSKSTDNVPHQPILNLLNQQQNQAAYQLATKHLAQWEGDADFDLAFALAAKAVGNLEQAVFAFERLLENNPGSGQIRYFLAVTYYEIENFSAAQQQFTLLQNSASNTKLQQQSQQYLNVIKQRIKRKLGHWQNWLKLSGGYDSNANNGIKDEFITLPLFGTVRLFEQSREIKSAYADAQAQLVYVKPQNQISTWYAGVDAQHINFSEKYAWSRTFIGALAGYKSQWHNLDWDINGFYHRLILDGNNYLNYGGMNAGISYPIDKTNRVGLVVSYAKESYLKFSQLDKDQTIASIWYSQQFNKNIKQKFDLRIGTEDADDLDADHISRNLWGASYLYQWRINSLWGLQVKADYLSSEYQGIEPSLNSKQSADLLRAEVELQYRFMSQWSALVNLNHMQNNSNAILYDYDRDKLQLSIKYDF